MTRPTSAFVTFEEEDAKLIAMKASDNGKRFMTREFVEPSEPTDIIWENRHWTKKEIMWRAIFAWVIIIALMACSFVFILWVSSISSTFKKVFPTVNC